MSWLSRKQNNDAAASGTGKHLLDLAVLEKRLLFSATPLAPLVDGPAGGETNTDDPLLVEFTQTVSAAPADHGNQSPDQAQTTARLELVFVDSGVGDYQQLIDDLEASNSTAELEIYLLDASRDGVQQISEILSGYDDVDAIHVLSHGNDGKIRIGNTVLESGNLDGYAGEFAAWQSSLTANADLLLYGCELAETNDGRTMLEALAELTGADVAASTDDTGHDLRGGDWDLEYQAGVVDSASILTQSTNSRWVGVLAVPVADLTAGGSHTISEGDSLSLDGSNSSDGDGDTLNYAWDLDNDGIFGETNEPTTETASVDWATLVTFGIDDDGTYTIGLQVDDGNGGVATQTTTVTVENAAPILSVTGSASVLENTSYTLNLAATDPGDDTLTAWRVDWGDGTINLYSGTSTSVNHTYTVAGLTHNILVSATDEDGLYYTGDLFTASGDGTPVRRYDAPTGSFELGLGTFSDLKEANEVLIGPDGLLYVSGFGSNKVQRFDPDTGVLDGDFVTAGSGGLNRASGIAFGRDGNFYVGSYTTDEVLRYDGTTGAFIDVFVSSGLGGLDGTRQITFGSDGNLYVASENDDSILRYNGQTGAFIDQFVTPASGGLDQPTSFTFGRDGNLYVTSFNDNEVLRFNGATGAFIDVFVTAGLGGLRDPSGLAFGPDDLLYVTDNWNGRVLRYNSSGSFVDQHAGGLFSPNGIEFTPTHQVAVLSSNTVPLASNLNQSTNYNEDDPSVLLDDIVVTDPDSGETITASLTLDKPATGALTTGTFGATTSTYNVVTGVWKAIGSVTNVNAALAAVAFTPALNNDTNSQITVHIEDSVGTGPADGLIQLNVTAQNDAPTIDLDADDSSGAVGSGFNAAFVEGLGAVRIADVADAVLGDVDNANLASLSVTITNLQDGIDEVLTFDTTGTSISGSYAAGVLTLSNSDSIANYQQVLRTIRYENLSQNPDTTTRVLSLSVSDGALSTGIVSNVSIAATNDAPTLDLDNDNSSGAGGDDFSTTFTEAGGAVLIADLADAVIADPDDANLSSLTITIANLLDGANEILSADTTGTSIVANFAADTLTLSGSETVANYQQVLRTVRYNNVSANPTTTSRTVEFVANDGTGDSSAATATVTITATNNLPVIDLDTNDSSGATGSDFNGTFVESGGSVLVVDSADAVLTDPDHVNLTALTATITNLLDIGDETLTADTTGTSIVANYATGTLTLSGTDTADNYQQVLRTVRYINTSSSPDLTSRTIEFTASDGIGYGNTATSTVTITATIDPPTIDLDGDDSSGATANGFNAAFNEDGGVVLIADSVDASLDDLDSVNLASLTVTITNLLDGASEILSANTGGTSISTNYVGGILSLTGTDTVANYQQVLRTVGYVNTSDAPDATSRLITFVANDGGSNSNVATATVSISPDNDAPTLDLDTNDSSGATAADFDVTFVEGSGGVLIVDSADAVLADADSGNLSSLTVTITNLFGGLLEALNANTTGTGISSSYVGGTLTLTGVDTVANYQQVLRTIQYNNTSPFPNPTTRVIQFVANDGVADSNIATARVSITQTNDAPTLDLDVNNSSGATGGNFNTTFVEGGGAVLIADPADAVLADVDNANLSSLSVTITNLLDGASETLNADTTGTGISASYSAGTLTLTGVDTVANYQQVLRTIQYENTSLSPTTTTRIIQFAANDGTTNSNIATANVSITPSNDAPTLDLDANDSSGATGVNFDATFTEGGGAVLIADSADAVLADVDNGNLSSLTVTVTNLLDGVSESLSADTTGTGISASYLAGTLTLTGTDSVANYQQVLRTIRYDNTSLNPDVTTRVVQFVANDGAANSNIATANVSITPTNSAPTLDLDANDSSGATGANSAATFIEGGGAVLIIDSADAVLDDVDSANLASLTMTITNLIDGASETLSADTSGTSIAAIYSGGTLTLSGADSIANYQQVLRSVRYENTSVAPDATARIINFVASDGALNGNVATATVSITATNTAPTITAPATQTPSEDTPWAINGISVSDPDIGAGTMQFSIGVGRGTLTLNVTVAGGVTGAEVVGNGSSSVVVTTTLAKLNNTLAATNGVTYLNNPNVTGADTLTIQASDMTATATAGISLNVLPTNDAPVAANDNYRMDPDSTLTVGPGGLLANDFDIDGDAISVVPSGGVSSGTLTLGADGSFQFTPVASFSGVVTFSYAVTDGSLTSAPATVVIQVSSPISPADIMSANVAPEPEDVVEEPADQEEESDEETEDETLLIDSVTIDRDNDAPVVFTGRAIVQTGENQILSLGVMSKRIADLTQSETESETVATSSDFSDSGFRERRSESSRSSVSVLELGRFDSKLLWDDMSELEDQITGSDDEPYYFAGTFAGFSGALSVGYVMWTVRGGLLATSLLAHLPAWSFVDPLLVLNELDDDKDTDDDSLEEMLDKKEQENDTPTETMSTTGETSE